MKSTIVLLTGYLLAALGLFVWLICLGMLGRTELIQAIIACFIGFTLFKGGLALIKLGTAAGVVTKTDQLSQQKRRYPQ